MTLSLMVGAVVAGRYRLDQLLGQGGMGQVWAATHTVTRRSVALKFLRGPAHLRPELRRRFIREARAASAVNHPNVVRIADFFELDDQTPVMVMDLLEGETLAQRIARVQKLSVRDAAEVLGYVVSAVGTAHTIGIVHRDLKPENIFLVRLPSGGFDVKVLDFGIAKLTAHEGAAVETGAMTGTGLMLGTPCYMSPEQIFGERDIDHRADIWAIGVMLYEALSGARPIEGDNVGQVLKRLMSQGIQPISALCPDLQQEIAALVTRMLARDKYERPEDLREVAEVLARYAGSRPPRFGAASSVKEKFDSDPQLSGSGTPPARVVLSSKEKADPEADTDMWKHISLGSESRERNTTGAHSMAVPSTPRRRNRWLAGDSTAPPTTLAPFFKSTVGKLVAVSVAAAAAASIAGVAWLDAAEAPPAPTSATAFSAPPVLTVVSDPAALDTVSMVREPSQGSRPSMPRSCAEVRDVTHATADGAYQIDSDGAGPGVPFPVYCTEMGDPALEPAEYLSLVHGPATGEPDANATTYVWSGGPCRCPDLTRRFTKVRLDPATLTVDVSDGRFSTYSRDRTCEAKDQNHCGASIELSWATAGSCRAGEDASGRGSIDLRDTPFSVAPEVAFVTSGNAAAGRASISTDRKTVALTGGGRCGVFLPSSAPKLRLSWDR